MKKDKIETVAAAPAPPPPDEAPSDDELVVEECGTKTAVDYPEGLPQLDHITKPEGEGWVSAWGCAIGTSCLFVMWQRAVPKENDIASKKLSPVKPG